LRSESVNGDDKSLVKDTFVPNVTQTTSAVGNNKTVSVEDMGIHSKSESFIGSEKLLIVNDNLLPSPNPKSHFMVEHVVGRSVSYEVAIVDSGKGFETEYLNYLGELQVSQDSAILSVSNSKTRTIKSSDSTTYAESKTLNTLCTVSNSLSYDDKQNRSYRKQSISTEGCMTSISMNESETTNSLSNEESLSFYDDDASKSVYSVQSESQKCFVPWC
jgi:hypothetical protein